ncbi:MAG: 3'(2'),5'-bisphosphate nucleotidase CysQ [Pseudomonadota bacterium]
MLENETEFVDLARGLLPATVEAGAVLMRYFQSGVTVERKTDDSPVTAADREAEDVILSALAVAAPGVPVVAEEQASAGNIPSIGDAFFLVDPLDGTRGFIKGRPSFTVNIGLVVRPYTRFGIIYAPASEQMFVTLGPHEAVEMTVPAKKESDVLTAFGQRQIHARPPEPECLRVATSRYVSERFESQLQHLPEHHRLAMDSSIKFCLVARGDAHIYPRFSEINEWDTAAGGAILQAAGGCVTDRAGARLTYGHADRHFRHSGFIAWGAPAPTGLLSALADRAT